MLPKLFNTQKTLGSLEIKVMKTIWQKKRRTVRDVLENLKIEKTFAYTTIMTVMDHLYKKGFVSRIKIKKTYYYMPVASEARMVLASFIPRINMQLNFQRTPITVSFLISLALGIFVISFWDLWQKLNFIGSLDYLKLILIEPKLVMSAFFESLPTASLITNLILFTIIAIIGHKMIKLRNESLV